MILLFAGSLLLPYIAGAGWIRLRVKKERSSPGQSYLMGVLTIFMVAQVTGLITIKQNLSFTDYCRVLAGGTVIVSVISFIIGHKSLVEAFKNDNSVIYGFGHLIFGRNKSTASGNATLEKMGKKELVRIRRETLVIGLAIAIQFILYAIVVPDTGNSTMVETITVTTATDTVFKYNPVTGGLMDAGLYPLYKLSTIKIFYSALQRLSGMGIPRFIYIFVPICVSLTGLSAMILWGEVLSRGMKERRVLFLMFYSILVLLRGGIQGTYAHVILHEAFKGKCIFLAILIPLFFCGIYLAVFQEEKLYGGAMSVLSALAMPFCMPLVLNLEFSELAGSKNTEWTVLLIVILVMVILWDRSGIHWNKSDIAFFAAVLICAAIPGGVMAYIGLAYCLTRICDMAREWGRRKTVYIGSILIICLYGTVLPARSAQLKIWETSETDNMLLHDIKTGRELFLSKNPGNEPVVMAQDHIMERCRLSGDNIRLLYGKDMWIEDCNFEVADIYPNMLHELHTLNKSDYLDPDLIADTAAEYGVNIIALREHLKEETMKKWGFEEPIEGPGYALYIR